MQCYTHDHKVKLFLQYSVTLLPRGARVVEWKCIEHQTSRIGPHMTVGHLYTAERH